MPHTVTDMSIQTIYAVCAFFYSLNNTINFSKVAVGAFKRFGLCYVCYLFFLITSTVNSNIIHLNVE